MNNIIDSKPKTYAELCEIDKKQNFGSLYDQQNFIYNYDDVLLSRQIMEEDKKRLIKESSSLQYNEETLNNTKNNIKIMPGIGKVMQIM